MEFNQESNDEKVNEEEASSNNAKQWFQDNLRIIISVLIVVVIAGGIYSYSKRTQAPTTQEGTTTSETATDNSDQVATPADQAAPTPATDNKSTATSNTTTKENTSSVATSASQETETSFVETAAKGDGMTKLARKSLANYLEKNPDSTLSAEHKIYVEDYLRKNVNHTKSVTVGTSVEFSKGLIKTAIEKSQTLTPKQLQNLHKYTLRVSSLS